LLVEMWAFEKVSFAGPSENKRFFRMGIREIDAGGLEIV